jgi:hypothetical protein
MDSSAIDHPGKNRKFVVLRRDARAVEWGGLENRYMGNYIEGSNPSLSAITHRKTGRIK